MKVFKLFEEINKQLNRKEATDLKRKEQECVEYKQ